MSAKAEIDESRRKYEQDAVKAQLIRELLNTDTTDPKQLANFLQSVSHYYLMSPCGHVPEGIPPDADYGLAWTMTLLVGDDDAMCPELVLAMQKLTPTDEATGWLAEYV